MRAQTEDKTNFIRPLKEAEISIEMLKAILTSFILLVLSLSRPAVGEDSSFAHSNLLGGPIPGLAGPFPMTQPQIKAKMAAINAGVFGL